MRDRPRVDRMDPASALDALTEALEGRRRRVPVPPVRGARSVSALLPNGQVVSLRVRPALAPLAATNELLRSINQLGERREATSQAHRRSLQQLSRKVSRDSQLLSRLDQLGSRRLRRRLVSGEARLSRRISHEGRRHHLQTRHLGKRGMAWARHLLRRNLWDQITMATSLPLFAAYGQKGSPLAPHNTGLAVSLGTWLIGDEVAELLSGRKHPLPHAIRDSHVWSYLSPPGNVLAGWWLMRHRQHERFITGFTDTFTLSGTVQRTLASTTTTAVSNSVFQTMVVNLTSQVDLAPFIALEHFPDFATFSNVPANATVASLEFGKGLERVARVNGLTALVERGVLHLSLSVTLPLLEQGELELSSLFTKLVVAWVVDTTEPGTVGADHG